MIAYDLFDKKEISLLSFINWSVNIFDRVLFQKDIKGYPMRFLLQSAEGAGLLECEDTLNLFSGFERKIYEAAATENRLHMLCEISSRIKYPYIKTVEEYLHPQSFCEIDLASDARNYDLDRQGEYQKLENCVTALMKKYSIPDKYRPFMMKLRRQNGKWISIQRHEPYQPVYQFNPRNKTLFWCREWAEVNYVVISEFPNEDPEKIKMLLSMGGTLLSEVIQLIECMANIYNIEIDTIVAISQKLNYDNTRKEEYLRSSEEKYETMPSTHRRAAVMALIDKSGLCKNIDRTKKAAFVEAVTGGNINAKPKDSVSYKRPEQKAIDAAAELLKTIGIE